MFRDRGFWKQLSHRVLSTLLAQIVDKLKTCVSNSLSQGATAKSLPQCGSLNVELLFIVCPYLQRLLQTVTTTRDNKVLYSHERVTESPEFHF